MVHNETLNAADLAARAGWRPRAWLYLLLPLVVLAVMVWLFLAKGELLLGKPPIPPDALLKVDFERLVFRPGEIVATVRNTGPDVVTIAQVTVNEALWQFAISPGATLARMGRPAAIPTRGHRGPGGGEAYHGQWARLTHKVTLRPRPRSPR
jgi:hypothetical protein